MVTIETFAQGTIPAICDSFDQKYPIYFLRFMLPAGPRTPLRFRFAGKVTRGSSTLISALGFTAINTMTDTCFAPFAAARGGVAPRGIVLLPTGATGGAGREGAPGAVGAEGAGGAPPMLGRGGPGMEIVGAGGAPPMDGRGGGLRGTVAGGASLPGALGRRVIRTVSFLRGTAEVLVVGLGGVCSSDMGKEIQKVGWEIR